MPHDVYCDNCRWSGKFSELVTFEKGNLELCPECKNSDIHELDSVTSDDYLKQERIVINE